MRLVPCSVCLRHVLDDAAACPFCATPRDVADRAPAERKALRLGRAAIMALGVAAGSVGTEACQKSSDNIAQPYGAPRNPPVPDAGGAAVATGTTPVGLVEAYGAPPPPPVVADAGPPAKKDAGVQVPVPTATEPRNLKKPYGAPPLPESLV